jgi:hypothetical protein
MTCQAKDTSTRGKKLKEFTAHINGNFRGRNLKKKTTQNI